MSSRRRKILPPSLRQAQPTSVSASIAASAAASMVLIAGFLLGVTAFTANPFRVISDQQWLSSSQTKRIDPIEKSRILFSSVGDDGGSNGGNKNNDDNDLGEFLDPMKKPDSDDMKRAREFMSETSLPISFDSVEGDSTTSEKASDIDQGETAESTDADLMAESAQDSSSLVSSSSTPPLGNATSSALFGGNSGGEDESKGPAPSLLAKNPYMQVVSKISPSDLIAKFTAESDPRVQEAVRTTILGLIGSLPKMAFETTSVITGQRLASLVR